MTLHIHVTVLTNELLEVRANDGGRVIATARCANDLAAVGTALKTAGDLRNAFRDAEPEMAEEDA